MGEMGKLTDNKAKSSAKDILGTSAFTKARKNSISHSRVDIWASGETTNPITAPRRPLDCILLAAILLTDTRKFIMSGMWVEGGGGGGGQKGCERNTCCKQWRLQLAVRIAQQLGRRYLQSH